MPDTPPRLPRIFAAYDPPVYFVTFNTHNRRKLLANEKLHSAFVEFAQDAGQRGICVGRYVIMPDHFHLFVRGSLDFSLAQWVRVLKRTLSKAIMAAPPHWQQGFFDHLIRHSESYAEKWEYVRQNPARAGLVTKGDEWQWQGEIARLEAR
jgi:REP element-mobilizing transposase RayT